MGFPEPRLLWAWFAANGDVSKRWWGSKQKFLIPLSFWDGYWQWLTIRDMVWDFCYRAPLELVPPWSEHRLRSFRAYRWIVFEDDLQQHPYNRCHIFRRFRGPEGLIRQLASLIWIILKFHLQTTSPRAWSTPLHKSVCPVLIKIPEFLLKRMDSKGDIIFDPSENSRFSIDVNHWLVKIVRIFTSSRRYVIMPVL